MWLFLAVGEETAAVLEDASRQRGTVTSSSWLDTDTSEREREAIPINRNESA